MLIAVNFHYVRPTFDAPHAGIHGLTVEEFDRQLETLSRLGEFVSAAQIARAVAGGEVLPERAFVVTFDDGLAEQVECAWPVLERRGIPAIFFVNTRPIQQASVATVHKLHLLRAYVPPSTLSDQLTESALRRGVDLRQRDLGRLPETLYRYDRPEDARLKYLFNMTLPAEHREGIIAEIFATHFRDEAQVSRDLYMSRDQVRRLSDAGMLGAHGHEHLVLGSLLAAEAQRQVKLCCELIREWTGRVPVAFSYPFGMREAVSRSVLSAARDAGIRFAFTMERAANRTLPRPLLLARLDCNDVPGGKHCARTDDRWCDDLPNASWTPETVEQR
jgi:peptidoglycan/xylan/chitin deacetylase (PgdA/CDA1 family)